MLSIEQMTVEWIESRMTGLDVAPWTPSDAIEFLSLDALPRLKHRKDCLPESIYVVLQHVADLESVCLELRNTLADRTDDAYCGPEAELLCRADRVLDGSELLEEWER